MDRRYSAAAESLATAEEVVHGQGRRSFVRTTDPPPSFPRRINVELTNHCNQRCPHCPRLDFTRPLGFLSRRLFERLVSECAPHPTRLWLHFLGEPLLHREVVDFIAMAKHLGVREVGLSTNAVGLNERLADRLVRCGLDRLECSVDGVDRASYLQMRGRDHFVRATGNIRAFLGRKRAMGVERPVTSIQFLRTPAIEADLPRVLEEWRPWLGVRDFVMTIRPITFGGAVSVVENPEEELSAPRPPCRWLTDALVVLQDGTVTMCGTDWDAHAPLGNITDSSITDIWNGPEMLRRRMAHDVGRFSEVGPCANCEDWRLADGHGYVNVLAGLPE